jgi:hypothetical protein
MQYYHCDDPYFADNHPVVLNEITAKDMLHILDPRDLPHRDYEPLLKYVRYVETRGNIMKFYVPSPTKINKWNFYIQFVEWDAQVRDMTLTPAEAARLLYWGSNIRVWCGCPSFLFWGYQYTLSQLDASIVPETRFPRIRNPQLKGILCKHGRKCIKTLGFYLGDMAKAIAEQRRRL